MEHETWVHMMENTICQHTLPYYYSSIPLFDQKKIFGEPWSGGGGGSRAHAVERRRQMKLV
jgi:hypothetical protein